MSSRTLRHAWRCLSATGLALLPLSCASKASDSMGTGGNAPATGSAGTGGAGRGSTVKGDGGVAGDATSTAGSSGRTGAAGRTEGGASGTMTTATGGQEPALGGTSGGLGRGGTGGSTSMGGLGAASGAGGKPNGGAPGTGGAPVGGGTIFNDRFWKDTSGTPIYSQGGGVLKVGDTYYWYGVKYGGAPPYAANPMGQNDDTSFQGVTIYSSTDLVSWKLEATNDFANAGDWFGRLGVAYNATTKKYVLVAQGAGGLYFATSDAPNGGFVFDNVQTNLPGIVNGATGDQTIFQDDDGRAYLVSSSSMGRANRYVSPLRAADFLAAEDAVLVYKGGGREGNCMFKYDGHYYFCSSDLHGWNSSATYCVSASDIMGPYGAEFVLDGTELDYSHVTQTGFFIAVQGSAQTTIIFAGDRWADFAGNGLGYNQWMPLSFSGTTPHFESLSAWTLNAATGQWSPAPENNWVRNPTFEADRVSVTVPVGWSATNGANSNDAATGNWSWQLTGDATVTQTIAALPAGTYALTVAVKGSGSAQLYVRDYGGSEKAITLPQGTKWTTVTIGDIAVTSGKAEVGVRGGSGTLTVDDFVLASQ